MSFQVDGSIDIHVKSSNQGCETLLVLRYANRPKITSDGIDGFIIFFTAYQPCVDYLKPKNILNCKNNSTLLFILGGGGL